MKQTNKQNKRRKGRKNYYVKNSKQQFRLDGSLTPKKGSNKSLVCTGEKGSLALKSFLLAVRLKVPVAARACFKELQIITSQFSSSSEIKYSSRNVHCQGYFIEK